MNTFGADTDEDVTDWGQENVETARKDARVARDVAAYLRTAIRPCDPSDLYFVCLNDEAEFTAQTYERAADGIEAGTRKFWPDERELEAARKAAWARLDTM